MVYFVLGVVGPRDVAAPVALSLGNGGSLTFGAVDDTAQVCVVCFGFRNMPCRVGQSPKIG